MTPLSTRSAAIDEMLTMQPAPRAAIVSPKTMDGRTEPWRFRRRTSSKASAGTAKTLLSSLRARCTFPPAALTRMSTVPHRSRSSRRARAERLLVQHIRLKRDGSADPGSLLLSPLAAAAQDRDPRPRTPQLRGDRAAQHPVPTAHQRHLAGEIERIGSPSPSAGIGHAAVPARAVVSVFPPEFTHPARRAGARWSRACRGDA